MADYQELLVEVQGKLDQINLATEQQINELREWQKNFKLNPNTNEDPSKSFADKVDGVLAKANADMKDTIDNMIIQVGNMAHSSGDQRLMSLYASLAIISAKYSAQNEREGEAKKNAVKEEQMAKRYLWNYNQELIMEANKRSLDIIKNGLEVFDDKKDDQKESLFLVRLRELLLNNMSSIKEAGKESDNMQERVSSMEKYQGENKQRDRLDKEKTEGFYTLFFERDWDGNYSKKHNLNMDEKLIGKEAKSVVDAIKKDYDLLLDYANQKNNAVRTREEYFNEIKDRMLKNYQLFKELTADKKLDRHMTEGLDNLCAGMGISKKTDEIRENQISLSNEMRERSKSIAHNSNELNNINIPASVKQEIMKRLETGRREDENKVKSLEELMSLLGDYVEKVNVSRDELMKACGLLMDNLDNVQKTEKCLKNIEEARDKSTKVMLNQVIAAMDKYVPNNKELVKKLGGEKKLYKELKSTKERPSKIGKKADLYDLDKAMSVRTLGGNCEAEILGAFSYTTKGLKELKELNEAIQKKEKLNDDEIGEILKRLALFNADLSNKSRDKYKDITSPFLQLQTLARYAMQVMAADDNYVIAHKKECQMIKDSLTKEAIPLKELTKEEKQEKGKQKKEAEQKKETKKEKEEKLKKEETKKGKQNKKSTTKEEEKEKVKLDEQTSEKEEKKREKSAKKKEKKQGKSATKDKSKEEAPSPSLGKNPQ